MLSDISVRRPVFAAVAAIKSRGEGEVMVRSLQA